MKIKEITSLIESVAPLESQLSFDNSGLQVGDVNEECNGILVTLDVTSGAIDRAIEVGANLIISHHPIMFYPMKSIVAGDVNADIVMKAIKNNITLYASHTNFDNAKGGITDALLRAFDVLSMEELEEDGTGRVAIIKPTRLRDIVSSLKKVTSDEYIRVSGDEDRLISRLAIINGAGGRDESLAYTLRDKGVELYITGEVKLSFALLLKEMGIALIDVEHYHAEKIFIDIMSELVSCSHIMVTKYYDSNPYNS